MNLSWDFLANRTYQQALLDGLYFTVALSVVSCAVSTVGGLCVAVARTLGPPLVRTPIRVYIEVVRNTPPVIQLFFWYFTLPFLFPPARYPVFYQGSFEFNAAAGALSIYGIAFVGEAIRSGIESIPKGQWEAAMAMGLSRRQVLQYVISRQSLPIVLPACGNEYIGLIKWSAIAMTIAVPELTWQAQKIETELFRGFEAITIVTLTYVSLCLLVGLSIRYIETRLLRGVKAEFGRQR